MGDNNISSHLLNASAHESKRKIDDNSMINRSILRVPCIHHVSCNVVNYLKRKKKKRKKLKNLNVSRVQHSKVALRSEQSQNNLPARTELKLNSNKVLP